MKRLLNWICRKKEEPPLLFRLMVARREQYIRAAVMDQSVNPFQLYRPLIGDSTLHFGEGILPGDNWAVAGDRASWLLDRIDQSALSGLRYKHIVLSIGGNDLQAGIHPLQIMEMIRDIAAKIHDKNTDAKIAWLAIPPLGINRTKLQTHASALNYLVERHCRKIKTLKTNLLEGPDGYIDYRYAMPDGIHVNDKAYRIIADTVQAFFDKH